MPSHALDPPRLIIFDLDGTLVDSLRDIADALNECLELLGLPARPVGNYRYMVGEGVPTLCRRAVQGDRPDLVARLAELARAFYRASPLLHTRPYPGVAELIATLRARGHALAVLSNKPHDMTVRVVRSFWPDGEFRAVRGYTLESLRKPDPAQALDICRELAVEPRRTWLVGDTPTDIQTARRADMTAVAVAWGFRLPDDLADADRVIHRPADLLDLLP